MATRTLNEMVQSALLRTIKSNGLHRKKQKFTFLPADYEAAKEAFLASSLQSLSWCNDGYFCHLEKYDGDDIYYDIHLPATDTTIMYGETVEVLDVRNDLVVVRVPNDNNEYALIKKDFFDKNFPPSQEHSREAGILPQEPDLSR